MSRSFSRLAVLSLLLLCALSGASAVFGLGKSKAAASGEVLVLDGASSFEEALKAHPFLVVEFYAPWCAPSRRIAAAALQSQSRQSPLPALHAHLRALLTRHTPGAATARSWSRSGPRLRLT